MTVRTITTDDGVRLHTRTDGERTAPWLLLLNSLGTDLGMWEGQIGTWATTHRILRFDQRGHGRSGSGSGPWDLDRLGQDARAVLDAYDVEVASVCGLSLGGLVTLWLAGRQPTRVRKAVLVGTAARIGTAQAWRDRGDLVRRDGMQAVVHAVTERMFSPAFLALNDPAVARVQRCLRDASVDGYAGCCDVLASGDLTEVARTLTVPTVVVVGTDDVATSPVQAQHLSTLLRSSRLVEIEGAGHLANLEKPGTFARVVHDFLLDRSPGQPASDPIPVGPGA